MILGIELDTEVQIMRLSDERMGELRASLDHWGGAESMPLEKFESLRGVLCWATKVIRPGRAFTRRITDFITSLITSGASKRIKLQLPQAVRDDILWWRDIAIEHN